MKKTFSAGAICAGLLLSGCMTANDPVRLKAGLQQQAIMRDGYSSLFSKRAHSMVRVASITRSIGKTDRPALRVEIRNISKDPQDVVVDDINAEQLTSVGTKPLKVYSFEDLIAEVEGKVVLAQVINRGAAVAETLVAPNKRERRRIRYMAYDRADEIDTAAVAKYAELENTILKDTSVLPGEKYTGYLYLEPPSGDEEKKVYMLHLRVGSDRHDIMIAQGRGSSPAMEAMAQAPGGSPNIWREWEALDRPVFAYAEPEQRVICTEPSGEVSLYSTLMCKPGAKTPLHIPQ
jgi:hypothetical protein